MTTPNLVRLSTLSADIIHCPTTKHQRSWSLVLDQEKHTDSAMPQGSSLGFRERNSGKVAKKSGAKGKNRQTQTWYITTT